MTTNRMLERWRAGESVIGGWCVTGSLLAAEMLAADGFDYLCADTQHGLMGYDAMVPVMHAVARTGTTPIARVPWNTFDHIGKTLDAGAEGVIVPMVNSREEAERAVAACRYAPEGSRSFGPVRAGMFLGADPPAVNREVACIVMIETIGAVAIADQICSTPGLDGVYIGPADLAITMGLSPSFSVPSQEHADAIATVLAACKRAGIAAGIHTGGGEQARAYLDQGFDMVTIATDAVLLRAAAAAQLAIARGGSGGSTSSGSYT